MNKGTILLSLLTLLFAVGAVGQTIDFGSIDLSSGSPVDAQINGLNMGGYAYARISEMGGAVNVPNECNQCPSSGLCTPNEAGFSFLSMNTNPNVLASTVDISPGILRFPGGTHSGWYHFYEMDNQGIYDAAAPVEAKGYGMSLIETAHLNNPLSYCRADSRLMVDQNYIDGFINYVNGINSSGATTRKVNVTYVANLLTHFRFPGNQAICTNCSRQKALEPMENYNCGQKFELSYEGNEALFNNDIGVYRFELYYKETQDAIEKIVQETGLTPDDLLYVEFGNEYYGSIGYPEAKYQINADNYAALAETYSERLKCYFDGVVMIKTGVVTDTNTPWQNTLATHMSTDLNGQTGTLGETIDAVILHSYYNDNFCLTDNNIDTRFDCAKTALSNFIENELAEELDALRIAFPNQRLWLTEWNIVAGTQNKNLGYLNTILHASFVQEFALKLLDYNALHDDFVEMSTHHRIGDHNMWSVLQTQEGIDEVHFRSGGFVMRDFKYLYQNDSTFYLGNVLTDGSSTYDRSEATTALVFQQAEGATQSDRLLLYYTNKTENDIPFDLPMSIDEAMVMDAQLSYVKGDYLFTYGPSNTTAGRNRFKGTTDHFMSDLNTLGFGDIHDQFIAVQDSSLDLQVTSSLPSHSVGVLSIQLNTTTSTTTAGAVPYVTIHPNPNHGSFRLSYRATSRDASVFLVQDMMGKVVYTHPYQQQSGLNQLTFDLEHLPAGVYVIVNGKLGIKERVVVR